MATSSERSPPPFPDSEDQEVESEEVRVNDSDDDGEDIFLNASDPPLTKMDTLPPTDVITTSQPSISPEPSSDLINDPLSEPAVCQTESKPVGEVISEVTSEPSDDFVDLTDIDVEAPSDTVAAENAIAEAAKDISQMPSDKPPEEDLLSEPVSQTEDEPAGEILSEPSDDFVDLLGNETEAPGEETTAGDVAVEAAPDGIEVPGSVIEAPGNDIPGSEEEPEPEEASSAPVMDISSDLVDITQPPISSGLVDIMEPPIFSDLADTTQPPISSDLADIMFSSELADITQPPISSELADVMQPLVSSELADVTQPPISSDLADVTQTQPLVSSDLEDVTQPPINTILTDPLVNVISAPQPAQKPSEPPIDLFEDERSDLFMEPRQAKPVKQPQTSIFDEPDEDLFSEPLGATSMKVPDVVNSEQKEKLVTAKGDVVSGPLSDDFREDPTDIFTEEAVVTAPSAASASSVNTKTNGVQSEEEAPDIFAEATVELSLDSPRNDRKKPATAKPAVSAAPSLSAAASASKPQTTTLEELEEEEQEDKFELNISITNPEKIGDGMNAYMAYKVSTQTTLPMFRNKTFTVRRRFSDFLGLYEKLSEKHSQSGFIVPPPPEKSFLGMTKVKVGKEDPSSAEFVERRRAALERYLQRVVCHPSLLQDPDVREFLEREELPRAVNTQALSGAGFLKMINKATDAVSKMTIKMNELDVWFEEKLQEVESEDQQFRKLHGMVESLVSHRKELSLNTAGFAKSIAMLGSSEDNTALSRALSQLAEVEDKMEQLHQEQASNDSFSFAELLADYIRLLGSVRATFDHRMKAWQRWQDAQNMLQKKRETEAKLLWANKPDKLQQAKEEISEWEAKVTQCERDFDRVSATVRKEVLRFEKEKARDFKRQIIKYLESLLQSQQQLMKYWEAFLPEAKAIA